MFKNNDGFSSYSINDVDAALAFYKDTLGLAVERTKEGLDITYGKDHPVFLYPKEDHVPATFTVLNFLVDNIDEGVEMLTQKGIELEQYDLVGIKTDERGIYRGKEKGEGPNVAWFKDPAGNILSVVES